MGNVAHAFIISSVLSGHDATCIDDSEKRTVLAVVVKAYGMKMMSSDEFQLTVMIVLRDLIPTSTNGVDRLSSFFRKKLPNVDIFPKRLKHLGSLFYRLRISLRDNRVNHGWPTLQLYLNGPWLEIRSNSTI
jgi:hypothetical protein